MDTQQHKRQRTNSFSYSSDDIGKKNTIQDDMAPKFGFGQKKNLSDVTDDRGDLWVHEKCATWTAATANSKENLSVTKLVVRALTTVFRSLFFKLQSYVMLCY